MDMKAEVLNKGSLEADLGELLKNEYLKITFLGQSFVYHQIRKMVGMTVKCMQHELDSSAITQSFELEKQAIWLAPSEGLLLERLNFDAYNKKSGIPEKIILNQSEIHNLERFKREIIYKEIINSEEQQGVFTHWAIRHWTESGDDEKVEESKEAQE